MRISQEARRRYVLGSQGLWPGRRWKGIDGARAALSACRRIRVDPLDVVGRSQDLAIASRVSGYKREHLDRLLYEERAGFEHGGAVSIYPADQLRLNLSWIHNEGLPMRWERWYAGNKKLVGKVLGEIKERGPLESREWEGGERVEDYRSRKLEGLALYFLWRRMDILVHHREGNRKFYDLTERMFGSLPGLIPKGATLDEMAYERLAWLGLSGAEGIQYLRTQEDGRGRSALTKVGLRQRLIDSGRLAEVHVEGEKLPSVLRVEDLPLLEEIAQGGVPKGWSPLLDEPEAVFLAPLDIVVASGRSLPLFGFEYLWEVYKPAAKRRWGYYVLPVLLGAQLAGRIEPILQKKEDRLFVARAWWEEGANLKSAAEPFARGLARFADYLGVKGVVVGDVGPPSFRARVERAVRSAREQAACEPGKWP